MVCGSVRTSFSMSRSILVGIVVGMRATMRGEMELKRHATPGTAADAFTNLVAMIDTLNYPLGVFINIDSSRTWAEAVPEAHRARVACLAVHLDENGEPLVVRD